MNKEFIPYEQALELKELGYNENYIVYYTSDGKLHQGEMWKDKDSIKAPLYQQAFRWFREKGYVNSVRSHNDKCHVYYVIHNGKAFESFHSFTYEQAELECLNFLIRKAKNK